MVFIMKILVIVSLLAILTIGIVTLPSAFAKYYEHPCHDLTIGSSFLTTRAAQEYIQCIENNPSYAADPNVQWQIGVSYKNLGDYDKQIYHYEKNFSHKPYDVSGIHSLMYAYIDDNGPNQYSKALELGDYALSERLDTYKIKSTISSAAFGLCETYVDNKQYSKAIEIAEKYMWLYEELGWQELSWCKNDALKNIQAEKDAVAQAASQQAASEQRIAELEAQLEQEKGGGCLIATATFGSEMAPQVQFLRELRDNTVLQTQSGTSFMTGFNQFYYSFSPAVADYERENPMFKEAVKLTLTPLLTSLAILNYVDIDTEQEMLGYGIGVILLNIGMYFVAPAIVIISLKKRFKF